MVIVSSPLKATGCFTRLLTSGPHGINRGVRKLVRTSMVIKEKEKRIGIL